MDDSARLTKLDIVRYSTHAIRVFDAFYRSGALAFGGGHVILPLLQQEPVATGCVSPNDFLAGYGAAQAFPGPLFTFAAFLGWIMTGDFFLPP
jgi:chromate transporter